MLSESQASEIKKQLIEQIEKTFPPESKEGSIRQIQNMIPEELEEFLIQNKIIKNSSDISSSNSDSSFKSPFRLIASGELHSYKIDENSYAVAVLEINPVTRGHVLVIPKKEIFESEELDEKILNLAKNTIQKIKSNLTPKPLDVSLYVNKILGEIIINIIPVYDSKNKENLDSPRHQASEEELIELQEELKKDENKKEIKEVKEVKIKVLSSDEIRLPRRIP